MEESRADAPILTVSQLTREIREILESRMGSVWVEGEISNHRLQSSGHQYFTLKDAGAQLSCVLFRGAASRSPVRLGDGVQVQLYGEISVYESRGQYQMVVRQAQLKGQGSLQARFEALKRRLYDEGLFDEEHKQAIPRFPKTVALITSPTGAAIRDMLNILERRAPWLRVLVFPVRVQGVGVEGETIRALQMLNQAEAHGLPVPDTIVIGRGGGSIEDLWAYNEETLARAIFASRIPVISAVGHEIDFTIADFVADLRAPTPSAAAELLTPETGELRRHFEGMERRMRMRVSMVLEHSSQVLELMQKGALQREPGRQLQEGEQLIDDWQARLADTIREQLRALGDETVDKQQIVQAYHPQVLLTDAQHRWESATHRLQQGVGVRLQRLMAAVESREGLLRTLGPEGVLARGFSYTTNAEGKVLKDAEELAEGDILITRLAKGSVRSEVK